MDKMKEKDEKEKVKSIESEGLLQQTGKSKQPNDSLMYSESEQLQFSQPKKLDDGFPINLDQTPDQRRPSDNLQVMEVDMEDDSEELDDHENYIEDPVDPEQMEDEFEDE